MVALLVDSEEFVFADGGSGKVINLGSPPNVGDWDVLLVNSNTTITTPSGFTVAALEVTNQGAYIFARKAVGGEASTVTVTTNGNHNSQVSWERWSGLNALDTGIDDGEQANASSSNATPAYSTGTIAAAGSVIVFLAALHSVGATGNQTSPVFEDSYVTVATAKQGVGVEGVTGFTAYKIGVGTAAETPGCSWSGDGAQNRYALAAVFSVVPGEVKTVSGSLALSTNISGSLLVSSPAPEVLPAVRSGWYGYLDILQEASQEYEYEMNSAPVACPNDGEPLQSAPDGSLFCPYDGWPREGQY